jgi:hypothetical protein
LAAAAPQQGGWRVLFLVVIGLAIVALMVFKP